jgi:hypothetical protein
MAMLHWTLQRAQQLAHSSSSAATQCTGRTIPPVPLNTCTQVHPMVNKNSKLYRVYPIQCLGIPRTAAPLLPLYRYPVTVFNCFKLLF